MIAMALAASEKEELQRKQAAELSEEEQIRRAIAESEALEAKLKSEDEASVLAAMKASELELAEE